MRLVRGWTDKVQKLFLCLIWALSDRLWDIFWEFWLQDNIVVKVVFEILSAFASSMAVINTENLQFWPFVRGNFWCFCCRLYYIKNNWYSIFVGFPYNTYICVRCKCFDRTKCLWTNFTSLEEWQGGLRLIFLQELCYSISHLLRCSLCFSPWSLWVLNFRSFWNHHCLHCESKGHSLPIVLHETIGGFRSFEHWLRRLRRSPISLCITLLNTFRGLLSTSWNDRALSYKVCLPR